MAGPYVPDPDNPGKQIPAPRGHRLFMDQPSTSHIPIFDTDVKAQVIKPAKGTMTYSIESNKIYIYNGSDWYYIQALIVP